MRARLALVVVLAALLASLDLLVKSRMPVDDFFLHGRSAAWFVLCVALVATTLVLARVPSWFAAASSGILAGGVLGNLVSAWAGGGFVPNVFVWDAAAVAFNLADVFILGGIALEMLALSLAAVRFRHVLPDAPVPVRVARRLRR
jgi:hypothetical protein